MFEIHNSAQFVAIVCRGERPTGDFDTKTMLQSNRPKLVVLDQNLKVLSEISRAMMPWMETFITVYAKEAMARLQQDQTIKVFLTEQILSNTTGITLLDSVRSMRPDVRRVLMCDDGQLTQI